MYLWFYSQVFMGGKRKFIFYCLGASFSLLFHSTCQPSIGFFLISNRFYWASSILRLYGRKNGKYILQFHWTPFHCLPFCLIWLNKMRIWEEPIKREVLNRFLKIFTANLSKTITRGWLSLKLAFISLPASALLPTLRVILPHEDPGVKFNESFMGMPMSIYGETLKSYKLKFFQYSLTIIVDFEKSVLVDEVNISQITLAGVTA